MFVVFETKNEDMLHEMYDYKGDVLLLVHASLHDILYIHYHLKILYCDEQCCIANIININKK